jgi:transposase
MVKNGQSVPSVSQALGIGESLLYKWKSEQGGKSAQLGSSQELENETLRKQVKQLELEREILKKALGIFSRVT